MRTTGIIRSLDNLGKIVIPRKIRKQLEIKENQPMEIVAGGDSQVILRKHAFKEGR